MHYKKVLLGAMVALVWTLLGGCSTDSEIPDGSGRMMLRVQNVLEEDQVAGFVFQVWTPDFLELVESVYAPLEEDPLPEGYYSESGAHLFSDAYFQLLAGTYDVVVQPMASETEVSTNCHPGKAEDVMVIDGKTKELAVVCYCDSYQTGGLDVFATLNHAPYISDVVFDEQSETGSPNPGDGTSIHTCDPQSVRAEAVDWDGDTLTYAWSVVPPSPEALFQATPDGDTLNFVAFETSLEPYMITVTVCDDMPQPACDSHEFGIHVLWNQDTDGDGQGESCQQGMVFYHDGDGDGYGDARVATEPCASAQGCLPPDGYVSNDQDCDDTQASIHPGAEERCNGLDENCNLQIDEGTLTTYYADQDGDGYGNSLTPVQACDKDSGYVTNHSDCNDGNTAIYPGAEELVNGVDDDCDGMVDEGALSPYYRDSDRDGYGDPTVMTQAASAPVGYVADMTDCDDSLPTRHPGAVELCNGLDDNCDAILPANELDADGDGYRICAGDCNDALATLYPGATESCDWLDNDCDGQVDEGVTHAYWADRDGDGHGDSTDTQPVSACTQPAGRASTHDDCDDVSATIYPGAEEACNGLDDDCDGVVDEGAMAALTWYKDGDGDSYGAASPTLQACSQPTGYVSRDSDCNDGDKNVYPGALEQCNQKDDDCDGLADDGLPVLTYYRDLDGDGHGDAGASKQSCAQPAGYVLNPNDCDDSSANSHPGATELCDSKDNDCDGQGDPASCQDCKVDQSAGPYYYIQDAILDLEDGLITCENDTITVGPGTYKENLLILGADVNLVSSTGSSMTTLMGNKQAAVVTITNGAKVTLNGFSITNGAGSTDGTQTGCGGGVFVAKGSTVTLISNNIFANTGTRGGGVYIAGGSTATLTGNMIAGNTASGGNGGGIYVGGCVNGVCSSALLTNNVVGGVTGNSAASGGGLFIEGGATVTMSGNRFERNGASSTGGGIYAVVSDSRQILSSKNDLFQSNATTAYGGNAGGVYAKGGRIELDGTQFISNGTYYSGGGVLIQGTTLSATGAPLTFKGNSATSGGAIFADSASTLHLKSAGLAMAFESNTASNQGGAIYTSGGMVQLANIVFTSNSATKDGGALLLNSSSVDLTALTFVGNRAGGSCGGACVISATPPSGMTQADLTDLTFTSNEASRSGGGLSLSMASGTAMLEGATFTSNKAAENGGAANGSAFSVRDGVFVQNTAGLPGGALSFATGTVENSYFEGNKAPSGGAINAGANVTLRHNLFTANRSITDGGTVVANGANFLLHNNIFSSNRSYDSDSSSSSAYAGAVLLNGGSAVVRNNTFAYTRFATSASTSTTGDIYLRGMTSVDLIDNILLGRGVICGAFASDESPVTHTASNAVVSYRKVFGGYLADDPTPFTLGPQFVASSDDELLCNEDYHLGGNSPYLNQNSSNLDPDGSYGQYGAFGGSSGSWPEVYTPCTE